MPNSFKSIAYNTIGDNSNENVYTCGVVSSVIKSLSVYNTDASTAYAISAKIYKAATTTTYTINFQSIAARSSWSVIPSDGSIILENGDKIQVSTSKAGLVVSMSFMESSTSVTGINLSAIADVSDTAATDNQVLTWDTATGLATWETLPLSAVEGTAPITVSGTTTRTVAISAATTSAAGSMSSADKTKLDGIATGAEVNQNAFSNVAVAGQTTVEADGKTDTLTLVAGTNITITTDAATDSVTISASGGTSGVTSVTGTAPIVSSGGTTPDISISAATTSAAGSMSAADKTKLDGIAAGAEVNVNADWNAVSGDAQILNKPTIVSSVTGTAPIVSSGGTTPAISISAATTSTDGSMSSADKTKLDGIEALAEVNQNAFSNVAVAGQTTVAADTKTDTITIAQSGGMEITTNATTDTITLRSKSLDEDDVTLAGPRQIDLNQEGMEIVDLSGVVASFADGVAGLAPDVRIFGGATAGGQITFLEGASGANYVGFKAPDTLSANNVWTLPSTDGTSGQLIQTNGSDVLSFVTKKVTQITGKTVATGAWSLVSGVYEASISDSAILSTSIVDVIPDNGSASTVRTAQVLPRTDSSTGSVKIYSTNLPAATITVTLNIFDL
jgi:hypothetical protein